MYLRQNYFMLGLAYFLPLTINSSVFVLKNSPSKGKGQAPSGARALNMPVLETWHNMDNVWKN